MYPASIATVLLGAALLMPAIGSADAAGAAEAPSLSMSRDAEGLTVSGSASSDAHETILRETARSMLGDDSGESQSFDMSVGPLTPPGWSLITEMVLRTLLTASNASAEITPQAVVIEGVSADADRWEAAIQRVDAALLDGMSLRQQVVAVDLEASYETLCRRQFLQIARDNRIKFFNSGSVINSDAYRSLDALVELSAQCPDLMIEVIGHTDSSGDEAANLAISEARAAAVVAYMVSRGMSGHRLSARGAGSSRPLVADSNRNSRRLNRRVEFRLLETG